ncbi:MAG: DUF2510 domain-containing protein [Actinobacteria bacterium]|uniref:Unannotated protein n=1 Tax=freshwater metagenome TaxID=449393 RepID=A0A6J7NNP8_9ZZZZ|nr:DUF2510 domain-containing protein [Actinomycetota bacterium]
MSTAPGWYPDPSSPTQLRWWTGSAWSEQTAPRPETAPTGSPWPQPGAPSGTPPVPSSGTGVGAGVGAGTRTVPPPPPPVPSLYPAAQTSRSRSLAVDWSNKPSYFKRFLASFLDSLFSGWPALVGLIITLTVVAANDVSTDPNVIDVQLSGGATLAIVLSLFIGCTLSFVLFVWNQFIRQGRTGQTVGKKSLGLALVNTSDGTPCSGWRSLARIVIVSAIGSATLGIFRLVDALWPLWDARGQRVVDKMLDTVVVRVAQQ